MQRESLAKKVLSIQQLDVKTWNAYDPIDLFMLMQYLDETVVLIATLQLSRFFF
jgi:hypothetical protein